MRNTVLYGDALEQIKAIPDDSVQCCVTSPPYWGLRDYGKPGQLGLEETPQEYVTKLVDIFREVKRVLRPDGVLWLNLGDTYASNIKGTGGPSRKQKSNAGSFYDEGGDRKGYRLKPGLPAKNLMGVPWDVAKALQADGWWLRNDIIWHKSNVMPTSTTDRITMCHEYIFLLAKSEHYFYDPYAIRERTEDGAGMRNKRSIWAIPTVAYKGAHFATFPPAIPELCIEAGTSEKGACPHCGALWERIVTAKSELDDDTDEPDIIGWAPTCKCVYDQELARCIVLDPFSGSGTTLAVAVSIDRDYLGIELNTEYKKLIKGRLDPELEDQRARNNKLEECEPS